MSLYYTFSLTVSYSYERTQTKTNNCTTIYLRSQYTLVATSFYFYFPLYLSYDTVQNYHRRSTYRSNQIEQKLLSYYRISTIPTVLALVPVASAWTTTNFPTWTSFLSTFKDPTTTTPFQGYDNNNVFGLYRCFCCTCTYTYWFYLYSAFEITIRYLCFGLRVVLPPK